MVEERKFLNGVWRKVQLMQYEEDEKQKVLERNKKIRNRYIKKTFIICILSFVILLFIRFSALIDIGIYGVELIAAIVLFYAVVSELNLIDEYK